MSIAEVVDFSLIRGLLRNTQSTASRARAAHWQDTR